MRARVQLVLVSLIVVAGLLMASNASAQCAAAWSAATAYTGGQVASRTCGTTTQNYLANWWTQGNDPCTSSGAAGSGQPWTPQGVCSGTVTATPTSATATPTTPATATPTTAPSTTPVATATATATRTATATTGATATSTPTVAPTSPPVSGRQKGLYYAEWNIYARAWMPRNISTSGQANNLTFINFAFGNVTSAQCVIGDSYADYDKAFTAAESVDGVADCWDVGCQRGLFNQFKKLKVKHPAIKVIYSFGGWTWSGGFGAAAQAASSFATSCYNLVNDARWAGTFNGIDIDWEYPNACGLSCDTSGFSSYKNLMAALRAKFGSALVTSAITADGTTGGKIDAADYAGAAQYVNWYALMTYDYFGSWAATGPTAPHAPLTSFTGIPQAGFYSDAAVQKLKSKGVAGSKILLGLPAYGRGWTGVTQAAPGGSATQAAPGTYEAGNEDYYVLASKCPANGTVAGTAYAFCSPNWWSYDTPSTISSKMSYVSSQGLGGAFFWESGGDRSNVLISKM